MQTSYVTIDSETLRNFVTEILCEGGFTKDEAAITARSLVLSNLLSYDSHGVIRATEYLICLGEGTIKSDVDLDILSETPTSILVDAQLGLGQVQMRCVLDHLIKKAHSTASVTAAIRHCGHIGRLGEWVELIAENNMAGWVAVNDNGALHCVAPPGGKEPCTSTNPMAFGIPLPDGKSFTIDISTSSVAVGKIRLAQLSGEKCPPNLIQDAEGRPTTDPSVLFQEPRGALLPMGGYKGFALSMMMDCLVAGLSGGLTPPATEDSLLTNNVVVTLWNPTHFSGLAHMQKQAEKYLRFVRQITPIDPLYPVRIPGDRSLAEKNKRSKQGIPLSHGTVKVLSETAQQLGISIIAEFQEAL